MACAQGASAFAGDAAALRGSSGALGRGSGRGAVVVTAKESRIGKNSVKIPKGVTVTVKDNKVVAKARAATCEKAPPARSVPLTPLACPRAAWRWHRAPRASCRCRWTRC